MSTPNPLILASDNSPTLLPLLQSDPSLATTQDTHGYSLLHAAASYNHLPLLRTLITDFHVLPNILDEDGETALFVAETVEAARLLVEELNLDVTIKNTEGQTAEEKIREEGEFVAVADYLKVARLERDGDDGNVNENSLSAANEERRRDDDGGGGHSPLPPLPPNVTVNMGTTTEDEVPQEADPEFRRRIEELAARDDFGGEEGQRQLRELVTDAVRGVEEGEREVRRRVN